MQHLDPHPQLFYHYDEAIEAIALAQNSHLQQKVLRRFEKKLLAELGYGLDLTCDAKSQQPVIPELLYSYDPAIGIFEVSMIKGNQCVAVSGASLIALESDHYLSENELREAKKLMRFILTYYLGNKPLHSRKLFYTTKVVHEISN